MNGNPALVQIDADGRPRDGFGNHASAFVKGYSEESDKGEPGGSCNVRACQKPFSLFKHPTNGRYYCQDCAWRLNRVNTGSKYWMDMVMDQQVLKTMSV